MNYFFELLRGAKLSNIRILRTSVASVVRMLGRVWDKR